MDIETRLKQNTLIFLAASGRKRSELADYLGVRQDTLSGKLNRGQTRLLPHLSQLAEFFEIDPRVMLADPDRVWTVTDEYLGALEPVA